MWLPKSQGFARIDELGAKGEPFLFIISYDTTKIFASTLDSLPSTIAFSLKAQSQEGGCQIDAQHISDTQFNNAFKKIIEHIKAGDSYLTNLTFSTKIECNCSLKEIYKQAKAPYKLLVDGAFVCFSPEAFIDIKDNTISTYPMKGTIDATIKDAKEKLLHDPKELAEHIMIVDLMRNDLGRVGADVKVKNFRYIDTITTQNGRLLQTSSHISATLPKSWKQHIGSLLNTLLPAGSISGTPKQKTCEIINEVESHERGFYTGVFGLFDGSSLQSAVMIRFIEQRSDGLYYKSGGGITIDSDPKSELKELNEKIYIPR